MQIRSLRKEDIPQVIEILATRDGVGPQDATSRGSILEWIAFQNPYAAESEARYFAAEDNGRVVAVHGRMPVLFSLGGERVKGYYVHDLSVHRDALKKGQGLWLTLALAKAIEEQSDSFICLLGMTPLNQQMQRRRHYHEIFADSYVKVLSPEQVLPTIVSSATIAKIFALPVRLVLKAADRLMVRTVGSLPPLTRLGVFDERFDRLFDRVAKKLQVCSVKNSAYMQWKYGAGPCREDAVLVCQQDEELEGFVVIGSVMNKGIPVGLIKEIVADPERKDLVYHLFASAVRFLRNEKVAAILCLLTEERYARILKKLGFIRRSNHEAVFLGNLDKVSPAHRTLLSDMRNWHMVFGESDLFMFGRDRPSLLKTWEARHRKDGNGPDGAMATFQRFFDGGGGGSYGERG